MPNPTNDRRITLRYWLHVGKDYYWHQIWSHQADLGFGVGLELGNVGFGVGFGMGWGFGAEVGVEVTCTASPSRACKVMAC